MQLFGNRIIERRLKDVPVSVTFIFLSALALQLLCHGLFNSQLQVSRQQLYAPPSASTAQLLGIGDAILMSKVLMLWLQAFDNQPGVSIPFRELDYSLVIRWLETILSLDLAAQYPLLLASRVYTQVPDAEKQKQMLDFIYRQFLQLPNTRWPAMVHVVYIARHKLKDLPLALYYAHAMNAHITLKNIPSWVRHMELYVLEDMGEIEAAKVLIGGLQASGAITDPQELKFLQQRLQILQAQ